MAIRCDRDHEAMKKLENEWSTLQYIGVQVLPAYDTDPEERYEVRNCTCGSTLYRRMS